MKVVLLSPDAKVPARSTRGSAGLDLFASADTIVPGSTIVGAKVTIGRALIPTGVSVAIPRGNVGRVGSRSGLSVKHNIEVGAGWIDPDYRGEILVELKNLSPVAFHIKKGDRIAQLFVLRLGQVKVKMVKSLPSSKRGPAGFGSTGSR